MKATILRWALGSNERRASDLMFRWFATLTLALAMGGCSLLPDGGSSVESDDDTEDSASVTSTIDMADAVATAEADGITIDRENMVDFPCHSMRDSIMGQCEGDDVVRLAAQIVEKRKSATATAEAGGDADAPDPSSSSEATAGVDPDLLASLADQNIEVDLTAMADLPCHAMFDIIMGDCSEDDILRVANEVVALRDGAEGSQVARPAADFVPGSLDPSIEVVQRRPSVVLDLQDGATIDIEAQVIDWEVDGTMVRGYGYNGMVPGPLIKVPQGATITVNFKNSIDMPTTIHWHGLRHDNAFDGVPGVTQSAVLPGESFEYTLYFPDPGPYWYHPHVREDIQQDSGMYGVMLVEPSMVGYYRPVDHEEVIILDDLLLEEGENVAYGNTHANFAVMGRFGDRLLINGDVDYELEVDQGDIVRFHVANVANVRPFQVGFDGATTRLVGSDLGKYVLEEFIDDFLIAPAERYVVEVLFDEPRDYIIQNRTPDRDYAVGLVKVRPNENSPTIAAERFMLPRLNIEVWEDIEQFADNFGDAPDANIIIDVEVDGLIDSSDLVGARSGSDDAASGDEASDGDAEHDEDDEDEAGGHGDEEGHPVVEWEDDMLAANRQAFGGEDVRWIIRDRDTGAENRQLAYAYKVGDIVRMRWFNDPDSPHPMQHPIHIHGQRFLITAIDGVPNENLVWKDTFLMPIGSTVDILMEITNPGAWMVHCHIAEHLETGMMYQFIVTERPHE